MQLYPAIDLKDGKCVRLTQGSFEQVKVYDHDPVKIARQWVEQGATFLHLVDLDGALVGHSVNHQVIETIADEISIPIQIGGGIRDIEAVDEMLKRGVSRVIIGTKAVQNPVLIKEMVKTFGADQIVVGVDAKDGRVAIDGWATLSEITALDLCLQMKEYGVKHIVYTDISKDGMLSGPNLEATKFITDKTGLDIIASGGVSEIEDLKQLFEAGISGAIIGKALYENKLSLLDAVALVQGENL